MIHLQGARSTKNALPVRVVSSGTDNVREKTPEMPGDIARDRVAAEILKIQ